MFASCWGRPFRRRTFVLALAAAALAPPGRGWAQEAEEIFLGIRYDGVVDTVLVARFASGAVYLPVTELFGILGIDASYAADRGASGFFLREDRGYHIDLKAEAAHFEGQVFPLARGDYRAEPAELFLLPSVLDRIFGLQFTIEMETLTVGLSSREPLPVLATARRAALRSPGAGQDDDSVPSRSSFGRDRSWFDFGLVQYGIRASSAGRVEALGFDLGVGAKVLRGDLRATTVGALVNGTLDLEGGEVRWRQVFRAPRRLATQVEAGHLYQPGSSPSRFVGVRLTNEPVEPRAVSGQHVIEGQTGPDWEVELYRDMELLAYGRADARGRYRFTVPLSYGTTALRVREYGPTGQVNVRERRLEIPFTFLPPGELDYQLSGGRLVGSEVGLYAASLAGGLTDRVTARLGIDWRRDGELDHALFSAGLSARVARSHLIEAEVSPTGSWRASAELFPSGQSSLGASFIRHAADPLHNPMGRKDEFRLHGFVPVQIGAAAANLRVAGGTLGWLEADRTASVDLETTVSWRSLRSTLGYRRTVEYRSTQRVPVQSEVDFGAMWSVPRAPGPLRGLRGLLFDGLASYDQARGGWRSVRLGASAGFWKDSYVHLALSRQLDNGRTGAEIRVVLRPPHVTATTAAYRTESGSGISQEVRGVVAYDADVGRLVPTSREWLGRGGVTVRMFHDADGDGRLALNDTLLPGGSVRFRQPVRMESHGSLVRVHDLAPYHRYEADIDLGAIPDPALVPAFTTFSFIADPNVYRTIDIPFQEAGEVEGRVLRRIAVGYEGIGGVQVQLRRQGDAQVTTLQTFSDGGFYAFGLVPGRYEVSLDTAALRALDLRPEPRSYQVEVRSMALGPAPGMRFALESLASPATPAELTSSAELDSLPQEVPALLRGMMAAEHAGEVDMAIAIGNRLLRVDPDDLDTYEALARLYRAAGDLARARDAYRRMLSLSIDLPAARRELGLVLFELGERVEARAVLRRVLEQAPEDQAVRSALSVMEGGGG